MSEAPPSEAIQEILKLELQKLVAASKLPHSMTREQLEAVALLARVFRQSPEPAPQAAADPLAGISVAEILKAVRG